MSHNTQVSLIMWVILTVFAFLMLSLVVTPFVDLVAPWMVNYPCADGPFNCEDFINIDYAPMNYALLAIAAGLSAWAVQSVNEVDLLPDAPEPCDCGNCSECGVLEDYIDDQRY